MPISSIASCHNIKTSYSRYMLIYFTGLLLVFAGQSHASPTGAAVKRFIRLLTPKPPRSPTLPLPPPAHGLKLKEIIKSGEFAKQLANFPVVKSQTLDNLEYNLSMLIDYHLRGQVDVPHNRRRYNRWPGSYRQRLVIEQEVLLLGRPVNGDKKWSLKLTKAYQQHLIQALRKAEYVHYKRPAHIQNIYIDTKRALIDWIEYFPVYGRHIKNILNTENLAIRLTLPDPELLIRMTKGNMDAATELRQCSEIEARNLIRRMKRDGLTLSPMNNLLHDGVSEWRRPDQLEKTVAHVAKSLADNLIKHLTSGLEGNAALLYKISSAIDVGNNKASIKVDGPCGYQLSANLCIESSPILKNTEGKPAWTPELNFMIKKSTQPKALSMQDRYSLMSSFTRCSK